MNAATTFIRACRNRQPALPVPSKAQSSQRLRQLQRRPFSSTSAIRAQRTSDILETPATQHGSAAAAVAVPRSSSTSSQPSSSSSTDNPPAAASAPFTLLARVTRVGTMRKTVRVTTHVQQWDKFLHKHYTRPRHDLVSDPEEILVEGDVIRYGLFSPEEAKMRKERRARAQVERNKGRQRLVGGVGVRWVLQEVITPFGLPVEERVSRAVEREMQEGQGAELKAKTKAVMQKGGSGRQRRLRAAAMA